MEPLRRDRTDGAVATALTAAAYVCRDYACKMPTTDPDELARMLAEATKKPAD